jgi:uncharacterized linocin/CFP29 family protein
MTSDCSQVPWSDEQWARVNSVIQEEANRARVAATFLPLIGPLPPDTDFVRQETILPPLPPPPPPPPPTPAPPLTIDDRTTIQLATLQVNVNLRGAQMADPDLNSALAVFRRAANVLARLEDAVVFLGLRGPFGGARRFRAGAFGIAVPPATEMIEQVARISHGQPNRGLWDPLLHPVRVRVARVIDGDTLVRGVSRSIGDLESRGHFGPFVVVLDQRLFEIAQTPAAGLVLPQDRIIPFLGGGSLLRCSALPPLSGVVVALGGAPVELVVATDMTLQFLQLTTDPVFFFRVFERIVLRVKQPDAISAIKP